MADDYWKKYGEELAAKKEAAKYQGKSYCTECGVLKRSADPCPDCTKVKCVTCGHEFLNTGGRKRCSDCVGERSDTRTPLPGTRLSGLEDGRP